jgi:hypothetical protein
MTHWERWAAVLLSIAGLTAAAAPATAAGFSSPSGNVLLDPGAETGACTSDPNAATTVPGWTVVAGSPDVRCYPAHGVSTPSSSAPGSAYFGPGPYEDTAALTQTADVSSAAAAIDTDTVRFRLSAWRGGRGRRPGRARIVLRFRTAAGARSGPDVVLPAVTAADRGDRSGLEARAAIGTVPAGTRAMQVTIRFLATGGSPGYSADAHESGSVDNLSLELSAPVHIGTLTPPPSTVPRFDHVFMIMMENTNAAGVLGTHSAMPFLHELMAKGTTLADLSAVYHPSDENYLAIAGGDTYAHGAVYWPHIDDPEPNLGDELEARHRSWKAYEQGMGFPCNARRATVREFDPYYEPDDAPFINYTDVSDDPVRCAKHLIDTDALAPALQHVQTTPDFSWIAADDYYDGESAGNGTRASRRVQDGFLEESIAPILASPAWRTQRSLIIITWDEARDQPGNKVAGVLLGSEGSVRAGYVSHVRYDHLSTAATIDAALGVPPLTSDIEYATPIDDAFVP